MTNVLVIGSGIAGMTAAIRCAESGMHVTLVSPDMSERSQSVMAAGGINAALDHMGEGDSPERHAEDTLRGGCMLAGKKAVQDLCDHAPGIVQWLESLGTVFSRNDDGVIDQRAFGGQSCRRTCYCGASTGKQIVTALVMETRRFEAEGLIHRMIQYHFHSGLIRDGKCYGALLLNERTGALEPVYADAVIMATGGQNALFGKTTGSTLCDGYAAGRLLMPRDVISRCMYQTHRNIYLDISFRDDRFIDQRLSEVWDLCMKYRGIDIHKESIPVAPSVHFFMGGLAADENHETNVRDLYAIGECASRYHGANRLGGNSLLAAIYSGKVAADAISTRTKSSEGFVPATDFDEYIAQERAELEALKASESNFPVKYIRDMLAETMQEELGIVRDEDSLTKGIADLDFYIKQANQIHYDASVSLYDNYSLKAILLLAKATLLCARFRTESRGAHFRSDHPETRDEFGSATIITLQDGEFQVCLDTGGTYEN